MRFYSFISFLPLPPLSPISSTESWNTFCTASRGRSYLWYMGLLNYFPDGRMGLIRRWMDGMVKLPFESEEWSLFLYFPLSIFFLSFYCFFIFFILFPFPPLIFISPNHCVLPLFFYPLRNVVDEVGGTGGW